MDEDIQEVILKALSRYRGDNLERAKAAFRNCTPEQMNQVWSSNGDTRQQVLDGYQSFVDKVESAADWVRSQ